MTRVNAQLPPPGWYPDPQGPPARLRYWDGVRWTDHRHVQVAVPAYRPPRRASKAWIGWVVAGVVAIGAIGVAVGDEEGDAAARDNSAASETDESDHTAAADDADAETVTQEEPEPTAAEDAEAGTATQEEPQPTDEAEAGDDSLDVASSAPATQAPPKPRTYLVAAVTDGDTLRLANGESVRLVGIDAPEQGRCGSVRATDLLTRLVEGQRVALAAPVDDRDRYGRLLRYVNLGTMDAGLRMIKNGLAVARYDSRDGYDAHPREALYHRTDDGVPNVTCAAPPAPLSGGGGSSCASGYSPCIPSYPPDLDCADVGGPIHVTGSDPHGLDADGDGVACES